MTPARQQLNKAPLPQILTCNHGSTTHYKCLFLTPRLFDLVTVGKMPATSSEKYVLAFYVPATHTEQCTSAIFKTGAGTWPGGTYGETCFILQGTGQFRPLAGANPNIGNVGELEKVVEDKVEIVVFGRETVINAVKALRGAHPYEVVAYYVTKAEDI